MEFDSTRVLRLFKTTLHLIFGGMRTKVQPPAPKIEDGDFSELIPLRDAYRIMEIFVQDYLSRGDTSVSDFLCYAGLRTDGEGGDPAALDDFLDARQKLRARNDASGEATQSSDAPRV
jgi:hypothetical protein